MNIIECKNLSMNYGKNKVFENLNFSVKEGSVVGLLGKNGVGKSTTINILMGNLAPSAGECLIYGENSANLSPETRAKIGLLYEGHITYDYLKIKDLYEIYASQYGAKFQKECFFELFNKLNISQEQKISTLSCGQRSQVVLGLIFASSPKLLILDDYSLGLDTGYRRLFIDYLKDYLKDGTKSVLMTTHIVNDLEGLLDEIIILQKDKEPLSMQYDRFRGGFRGFALKKDANLDAISAQIQNTLEIGDEIEIYGFFDKTPRGARELNLSFEDAFLGYVGRY